MAGGAVLAWMLYACDEPADETGDVAAGGGAGGTGGFNLAGAAPYPQVLCPELEWHVTDLRFCSTRTWEFDTVGSAGTAGASGSAGEGGVSGAVGEAGAVAAAGDAGGTGCVFPIDPEEGFNMNESHVLLDCTVISYDDELVADEPGWAFQNADSTLPLNAIVLNDAACAAVRGGEVERMFANFGCPGYEPM